MDCGTNRRAPSIWKHMLFWQKEIFLFLLLLFLALTVSFESLLTADGYWVTSGSQTTTTSPLGGGRKRDAMRTIRFYIEWIHSSKITLSVFENVEQKKKMRRMWKKPAWFGYFKVSAAWNRPSNHTINLLACQSIRIIWKPPKRNTTKSHSRSFERNIGLPLSIHEE